MSSKQIFDKIFYSVVLHRGSEIRANKNNPFLRFKRDDKYTPVTCFHPCVLTVMLFEYTASIDDDPSLEGHLKNIRYIYFYLFFSLPA